MNDDESDWSPYSHWEYEEEVYDKDLHWWRLYLDARSLLNGKRWDVPPEYRPDALAG